MAVNPILQAQVRSLIGHVRLEQSRQLSHVLDRAEETATELVGEAHSKSRRAVHRAVIHARSTLTQAKERNLAAAATEQRRQLQQNTRAALKTAWPMLEEALLERWRSPGPRANWWREAIGHAGHLLPAGCWRLEHPNDWPDPERQQAMLLARDRGAQDCEAQANPNFTAGLRIHSGSACLDCTIRGLLTDRSQIEAALLNIMKSSG